MSNSFSSFSQQLAGQANGLFYMVTENRFLSPSHVYSYEICPENNRTLRRHFLHPKYLNLPWGL